MVSKFFVHLRAQWMGALALFLVIAGGTAYAANSIGSSDIIDGQVKTADIGNNQVRSVDVRDDSLAGGGLTGADIADQSGVDTCVLTQRIGSLCVRAENFARNWNEAQNHCANLDLRVPTLGEARQLAQTHDIPNVDQGELFWTDEFFANSGEYAFVMDDQGGSGSFPASNTFETVCVMTPTN